jgi:copper homeostasis protein
MMDLEICVDSVESAIAAEAGGAQRVELCSGLIEGGITPSLGLIRAVRTRIDIGVHVMIRPRGGDFFYSDEELEVMREDIVLVSELGVEAVVFGLLTAQGEIDVEQTRVLVELARPMGVTFHRAIDMTPDVVRSLEDVIATGADRVLTSGGKQTAAQGARQIRAMLDAAKGRIAVMAGGSIRADNALQLAQATGVEEFHSAVRSNLPSPLSYQAQGIHLGDTSVDDYARSGVRTEDVRALRQALSHPTLSAR